MSKEELVRELLEYIATDRDYEIWFGYPGNDDRVIDIEKFREMKVSDFIVEIAMTDGRGDAIVVSNSKKIRITGVKETRFGTRRRDRRVLLTTAWSC